MPSDNDDDIITDFSGMSVEQILAVLAATEEDDADLQPRASSPEAHDRHGGRNGAHERHIAELSRRERWKDDRIDLYRNASDRRLDAHTEDEPLAQLLAHATLLARGGEIEEAMSLAQVAGAIARAAKHNADVQPPRGGVVLFGSPPEKNSDGYATITVNTNAARASLARLIDHAMRGDTIIIQRANRPMVRLVPYWPSDEPLSQCPPGAIDLST